MLLSDIQGHHTFVDKGRRFTVKVDPGDNILLIAGCHWNSPASRLEHPGIAGKRREVYNFKHYSRTRGKWWTSKPGMSLLFLVPKTAMTLVEEATYSYVKVLIGGRRYTLDVSGGTDGDGWTDWVRNEVHISVGHPVSDLRNLAEQAIPRDRLPEGLNLPAERPADIATWERLVQERDIWATLKQGDRIVASNGRVYFFLERHGRKQQLLASDRPDRNGPTGLWRISRSNVDWARTAEVLKQGCP